MFRTQIIIDRQYLPFASFLTYLIFRYYQPFKLIPIDYLVQMPGESVNSILSVLRNTAANSTAFLARQVKEARYN
jgi:hypothetical protein